MLSVFIPLIRDTVTTDHVDIIETTTANVNNRHIISENQTNNTNTNDSGDKANSLSNKRLHNAEGVRLAESSNITNTAGSQPMRITKLHVRSNINPSTRAPPVM